MASSSPYIKSLIWLACAGGAGYGLLRLTTPSEEKLAKIKASGSRALTKEDDLKKHVLMQHIRGIAEGNVPSNTQQKTNKDN